MRLQTITRRLTTRGAPWALAAFGALFIAIAIFRDIKWALHDTQRQRFNLYNVILPQRLAFALADWENPERSSQPAVPELLAAPWMGTWPIPHLTSPRRENGTLVSPAWVMIHVFSTPSAEGAETRAYLRSMSPLLNVPPDFRHLIEVKFVMGYIIGENWLQREALDREQAKHGDLLFLTGLHDGENMNNGKTIQWIQYLGTQSVREAQWVIKMDEDTMVLLPNLLDWLVTMDPAQPTYFGTALTRWWGYLHYFEGMMYGLSWGVVKTIASADLPREFVTDNLDEDARTGQLMFSLPTAPGVDLSSLEQDHTGSALNTSGTPTLSDVNMLRIPSNPDPRTGLDRHDLLWRISDWDKWWGAGPGNAIAWHRMKDESTYRQVHEVAETGRRWRKFMWHPPPDMYHLRDPHPPAHHDKWR